VKVQPLRKTSPMWLLHKTRLCGQAKEVAKVRHELRNSKGKDLDRYEQAEM
jgi:hypothetical protein